MTPFIIITIVAILYGIAHMYRSNHMASRYDLAHLRSQLNLLAVDGTIRADSPFFTLLQSRLDHFITAIRSGGVNDAVTLFMEQHGQSAPQVAVEKILADINTCKPEIDENPQAAALFLRYLITLRDALIFGSPRLAIALLITEASAGAMASIANKLAGRDNLKALNAIQDEINAIGTH